MSMDLSLRARAAAAAFDVATFGFNPGQKRGPDGRFIKMGGRGSAGKGGLPKGARPSEGGGAGAGGGAPSAAPPEPHPVDERAELRAIQLAEIDRDIAAGRRRDSTQNRIDRAQIAIRRHADAVKMNANDPDDERWMTELRQAEEALSEQGIEREDYGYSLTGRGGLLRYNEMGALDARAGREAELDAREGALGPAAATPEIGPDGKYVKPVKQVATWNGRVETRTSRNPYNYASVVQVGDREPEITSWHRTRAAAEKGVLTKDQRDGGVRVVAVAEVKPEQPGENASASAEAQRASISGDVDAFKFDPRQKRDREGKWTDGGIGPVGDSHPEARSTVKDLRHIADTSIGHAVQGAPWLREQAEKLEQAIEADNQAEIDELNPRLQEIVARAKRRREEDTPSTTPEGVLGGYAGYFQLHSRQSDGLKGKLSSDQVMKGLGQYFSNPTGYKAINKVARLGDVPFSSLTKTQQERVRQLDRITSVFEQDATTLPQDVEAWRGVLRPHEFLGSLEPGMEFVDDAPTSVSLSPRWASNFATDFDEDTAPEQNAMFKIRVKAGQKGLVANAVDNEYGVQVGLDAEREMLLPSGTRYRVVGKIEDTKRGDVSIPTYEIEVVETPVRPPRAPAPRVKKSDEPGRNLIKAGDLPPLDRVKALDLIKRVGRGVGGGHRTAAAPELQDALIEALKSELDLNTRSARLLLKDFNKYGGVLL